MLRRTEELLGMSIQLQDGKLGELHDLFFDDVRWVVRYLVAHAGESLGGRHLVISVDAVRAPDWQNHVLPVACTREQVEKSPDIDLNQPVSTEQLDRLHQYYGWPAYWSENTLVTSPVGLYPIAMPTHEMVDQLETDVDVQAGSAHFRSIEEVTGYYIQARDGEIGHVAGFLLDDETWSIRYLLVATRNWLPGRTVPLSPLWIHRISWAQKEVVVDLTRDEIRTSPEYDPSKPMDRDMEIRLFRHYTRNGYWSDLPERHEPTAR